MPEAFIPIHMLFVKIKVNGVPTFAFIDSGKRITVSRWSWLDRSSNATNSVEA